jgi:hypothetical protein
MDANGKDQGKRSNLLVSQLAHTAAETEWNQDANDAGGADAGATWPSVNHVACLGQRLEGTTPVTNTVDMLSLCPPN